ncbi:hypothetical protein ACI77O_12815 [Pseudomonas tritici]|uniref:hypothetical protein n=1 Tax=Pseudomonas tritici TaxID=2745518 RepID=UPI00387A882C
MNNAAPTTRSDKLFASAFNFALAGQHRDSDEMLELAHDMRAQEQKLAAIAEHAPPSLAVLLVKAAMTGFTELTDPVAYVEANLESIKVYSKHDAQLKGLLAAIYEPKPYQRVTLSLTEAELDAARSELEQRTVHRPGVASVSDPVITPAAIGIQARGFSEFSNRGDCSILRQCEACRNRYETKVHFQKRIYWSCPHCNTIKEA